jgi:hypothetical protein
MWNQENLDAGLRKTLARQEPRREAVEKILVEVRRRERQSGKQSIVNRWWPMAMAAMLVVLLGVGVIWERERQREIAARETAAQVEKALLIASEKIQQLDEKLAVRASRKVLIEP